MEWKRCVARWTAVSASSALLLLGSSAFLAWAIWAASSRYTPLRLPVVPGSGVCFLALGAGLLGMSLQPQPRQRIEALVLGLATALFGYLALLECTSRHGWRMSDLFLLGRNDPILSQLVRMTPTTGLDFVLGGLSLAVLSSRRRTRLRPVLVHALGAVPLATGFVGLVDSGLCAIGLLNGTSYDAMPPLTSAGFVCLSIALLATLHAQLGSSQGNSGVHAKLLRRVVPLVLLLLVISTTVALVAVERGWMGAASTLALTLAVNGLGLTAILSLFATHVTRALWLLRLRVTSVTAGSVPGVQAQAAAAEEAAILERAGSEFVDLGHLVEAYYVQKAQLEAEAAQRCVRETELEAALSRAEAGSLAKAEFLTHMSHEVRTPLNGILGMTELTLSSDLSPQQRENLNVVWNCARDLLALLSDILDFSNLERGRLEISRRPTDLRLSLRGVLAAYQRQADAKGLRLEHEVGEAVPEQLLLDDVRLRQVLLHLTDNAIRFTERGDVRLLVALQSRSGADAELTFTVADTGVGIAKEDLGRIFDPFTQVDASMRRRHGGAGLGLAIAARLVEKMGGQLEVESDVGLGSRFSFTLRGAVLPEPAPHPLPRGATAGAEDSPPVSTVRAATRLRVR